MQEMRVPSLGWEDPMEEGMETHSSVLAWEISWTQEPGSKESDTTEHTWNVLRAPPSLTRIPVSRRCAFVSGMHQYFTTVIS